MTERGLPSVDNAPACPFVAFEDDREGRSSSPDHRHRCYADPVPTSRAAAHQEAYCLSSAFPVCPTFQDWARREAAHARGTRDRPRSGRSARPETADAEVAEDSEGTGTSDDDPRERRSDQDQDEETPIVRNPPRDWAAPPPWATGGSTGAARRAEGGTRPDDSRGLVGSAADRLAGPPPASSAGPGRPAQGYQAGRGVPPDDELAGLVGGRRIVERPPGPDHLPPTRSGRRPSVSASRAQRPPDRDVIVGPSWERSRRFEAYPTIRARTGLPAPPRLAVLAAALAIAAVGLFFLPALLGVGGDDGGGGGGSNTASPSSSATAPTASPRPTVPPAPTPQVYVIQSGDTLFGVADQVGLTLEELLAANPQITDPDKIAAGDEIIIPVKPPDVFIDPSASPTAADPSAEPS